MHIGIKIVAVLVGFLFTVRSYNICGGYNCIPGQLAHEIWEFKAGLATIASVLLVWFVIAEFFMPHKQR